MENRYNPVCWFELLVLDMDRAVKFYTTVFEYEFDRRNMAACDDTEMVFFPSNNGKGGIGGALTRSPYMQPARGGVLIHYYSPAEDLAIELLRVEEAGGKVIMPKIFINDKAGFMGAFIDSEGNRVGILSMK